MTYDDYAAGVAQFRATGSLIARPQRIVPVVILPAVVLWVPVAPVLPQELRYFDSLAEFQQHLGVRDDETSETRPYDPPDVGYVQETYAGITRPSADGVVPWRFHEETITIPARHPVRNLFAERIWAIAQDWLDGHRDEPANFVPDEDLVATLLDFARAGDETAFRELALMRGVPAGEIPAMWDGTVKRVGKTAA